MIFIVIGAAAVFGLLNYQYFWAQVNFFVSPPPVQSPTALPPTVNEKGEPNQLSIPSLGIKAPIVYAQEANEKVFQAALTNGVAHYPGTAAIGQAGNAYIFGHSSDFVFSKGHYKTVFALLPKIKIGDEVMVSDHAGQIYTYRIFETTVVAPTDIHYLSQDTGGKAILTVQTSYPVGTALKRFLARAELVVGK